MTASNASDWLRQGLALHRAGRLAEAESHYQRILAETPDHADANYLLGTMRLDQARFAESIAHLKKTVAAYPRHPGAWRNLALAYESSGNLAEAQASYQSAIELEPSAAELQVQLGSVLGKQGQTTAAIAAFERALAFDPRLQEAWANLGAILIERNHFDRAAPCLRTALQLEPNCSPALRSMVRLSMATGDQPSALRCIDALIALDPNDAEAHHHRAITLHQLERFDAARSEYERARALRPGYSAALANLGRLHAEQDEIAAARSCFAEIEPTSKAPSLWRLRAEALCPTLFDSADAIARFRERLDAALDRFQKDGRVFEPDEIFSVAAMPSFNLPFHGLDDRPVKEKFAGCYAGSFPQFTPNAFSKRPKVGFVVSHDEMAFLRSLAGFFEHRDPSRLDVQVLCTSKGSAPIQTALGANCPELLVLGPGFSATASRIRDAGFDILYYREVGTDPWNYFLPFLRLAPVQCTSFGIQVTTGIPTMDCYLSSELVEPTNGPKHYSEKLVLLNTLMAYRRRPLRPSELVAKLALGLPNGGRLYLCPHQLGKFHPDFDDWMRQILTADREGFVVITKGNRPKLAERLSRRLHQTLGEYGRRVVFVNRLAGAAYFSLLIHADVILDPPHFSGMNTTYDAFAMGKPVVTLPSGFHRGRYTLGCLRVMGIDDCIASTSSDYVDRAVRIACDRPYRLDLEARILDSSSKLFENAAAMKELEEFIVAAAP